jgi:hypothetical protein
MVLEVGNIFSSVEEMRDAIKRHVLDHGESYKVTRSEKTRYIMVCKGYFISHVLAFFAASDGIVNENLLE